jgi:hypothetical protein
MKILRVLLAALGLCALAAAQTPSTTTTLAMVREMQPLLASPVPCLVYIAAGKTMCASLGANIVVTANPNGVTLSVSNPSLTMVFPSPVYFPVTTAGTQTFTTTQPSTASGNAANSNPHYWVFRDGVLLNYGTDYTQSGNIAGSTVTLGAAQTTVPGDVIQIW